MRFNKWISESCIIDKEQETFFSVHTFPHEILPALLSAFSLEYEHRMPHANLIAGTQRHGLEQLLTV